MDRRQFLGVAAAGGVGLALGLGQAGCSSVPRQPAALRLAYYTDVHARVEWDTPEAMLKAARAINDVRPDVVIAGGDLITDGFQSSAETVEPRWGVYLAMQEAIEAPVYAVLGNHDVVAAMPGDGSEPASDPRAVFRGKLGVDRTYRSFDAGGYHVILLDSVHITRDDLKYEGRIDPEQLSWLRSNLAALDRAVPIIVATHFPLVTDFYTTGPGAGKEPPRNRIVVNADEVLACFKGYDLVLVLQGHLHVHEQVVRGGTTFVTGGAVCAKWWRGPYHGTEEGFNLIQLNGDSVQAEYIDYGWEARRPKDQ